MSVVSHARKGESLGSLRNIGKLGQRPTRLKCPEGSTNHREQWSKEAKIPIRLKTIGRKGLGGIVGVDREQKQGRVATIKGPIGIE